jgi:hypothetical protein
MVSLLGSHDYGTKTKEKGGRDVTTQPLRDEVGAASVPKLNMSRLGVSMFIISFDILFL